MKCPECGVEAWIAHSRTEVLGDDSPDVQTEVHSVLEYQCRNPGCIRHGETVGESRSRIYPTQEEV